jgi:LPXTG-site transpeptidase (sortase) family protein
MNRKLAATAMVAAGTLLITIAAGGFLYLRGEPAVKLSNPDPHLSGSTAATARPQAPAQDLSAKLVQVSSYAANRQAETRPAQPHTGLWVEIPALQIALPVREGDGSDRVPQWQALHYPGTVAPGMQGNSYLYAHGLWGMFGGLLFARSGDEVRLHDYGTGTSRVMHVTRVVGKVAWNDTRWIHVTAGQATLTLQTCVDDNLRGNRFVVQAT